ncbi:MAG TPA: hypothetical protein VGU66_22265 [Candidatus Elarobacter sp.]|nr:hypothetical protein [Candidatus Elarobacter sp.]
MRFHSSLVVVAAATLTWALSPGVARPDSGVTSGNAPPAITATFVPDATAHLAYGATSGPAALTLMVTGVDQRTKAPAKILGQPHDVPGGETTVGKIDVRELPLGQSSSRFFQLTLPVSKLARATTQQRTLVFSLAGADKSLTYSITNVSSSSFSLTPKAPATIAVDYGGWIPIGLAVGPLQATGVRLLQPTLVEKDSKRLAREPYLRLCTFKDGTPDKCDDQTGLGTFAPNAVYQVFVGPLERVGTFENQTLTIASDQKPDGDGAAISIYVSSWWHKALGVVAILAGVLMSWFLTVYIRGRIAYDQAYLPVIALRRALDASSSKLDLAPAAIETRVIRGAIDTAKKKLADTELEAHGMPVRKALPWTAAGGPTLDQYRQYIQGIGDRAATLDAIASGLADIAAAWNKASAPAKATLEKGAKTVDALAAKDPPPAMPDIQAAIATALEPPPPDNKRVSFDLLLAAAAGSARPITEQDLRVEISSLGTISWLAVMLVTVALGAYVLIYSSAGNGFGRVEDYLLAIFWGLGLPAASQLSSATSGTVKTTFNIATP